MYVVVIIGMLLFQVFRIMLGNFLRMVTKAERAIKTVF